MPLKFLKGLKKNLPDSIKEGAFYITADSQELFVDISDNERIALGSKIILKAWDDPTYFDTVVGIQVKTTPIKSVYVSGEYFDPTGVVVVSVTLDTQTAEITDYTFDNFDYTTTPLTESITGIPISYVDSTGTTFTTEIPITVVPFDPAIILIDFEYVDNGDGTYTLTDWKETYNGEPSVDVVVPNNALIVL